RWIQDAQAVPEPGRSPGGLRLEDRRPPPRRGDGRHLQSLQSADDSRLRQLDGNHLRRRPEPELRAPDVESVRGESAAVSDAAPGSPRRAFLVLIDRASL